MNYKINGLGLCPSQREVIEFKDRKVVYLRGDMEGRRNTRALFIVFLVMFVVAQHTSAIDIGKCAECLKCYLQRRSLTQCAFQCLDCATGGKTPPPSSSEQPIASADLNFSTDTNFNCILACAESSCAAHINGMLLLSFSLSKRTLNQCWSHLVLGGVSLEMILTFFHLL